MVSDHVRSTILLVALLGLVAAALFLWSSPESIGATDAPQAATDEESTLARPSAAGDRGSTVADAPPAKPSTRSTRESKTPREREAMRKQIVDALLAREAAAESGEPDAPRPEDGAEADAEPTPGDLKDRSGNHGYLLKVMNEELMPLADECYALARNENPELEGLLVLDIDIIGDEEIGGLVETVEPGEANELVDPILLECMRESLFATELPEPQESGRDAISLSMPLGPDA